MHGSRRLLAGLLGVGVVTLVAIGITVTHLGRAPAAAARSAGASRLQQAPAQGGAAKGGLVIVLLKNQHSSLNLDKQGRLRSMLAHHDQAPILGSIKAHGGTNYLQQLVSVNGVAANLSAGEVARLRALPGVASVVPDAPVPMDVSSSSGAAANPAVNVPASNPAPCPATSLTQPGVVQEPEADTLIQASTGNPNSVDMGNSIATGKGVVVAIPGMNNLAGNPNFTRADGSKVVVNVPSADATMDSGSDESYEDASSVAAQGTVVYQYNKALPLSGLPDSCKFYIEGDAPDASLTDSSNITTPPSSSAILAGNELESQLIAGIDHVTAAALPPQQANVISESYGGSESRLPAVVHAANDAAVAAGVTVTVSSGDSGVSGTMNPIAADPQVIAAGAVDGNRIIALNDGFQSYASNNIAAISSSGTAVTNKLIDVVAPGWYGGEAACAIGKGGCPTWYPTESARGTSEAAPLTAGAAADVIQAYAQTHGGTDPTPAMIKQIISATATDIDAPAQEQGGGLLNIYGAVQAAQQMPGTTDPNGPGDSPGLVASPSQLDLVGATGTTSNQTVALYNTSPSPTTVTGTYRSLGPEFQIGSTVTENISAPPASAPVPPQGATAAAPITFTVPAGVDRLDIDMIWPDPTNGNVIGIQLFNAQGAFVQESYDDGAAGRSGRIGTVSNDQHIEVAAPGPGQWTADILWAGTDADVAAAPATPGTYTGPMSFMVSGQNWQRSPASGPVTIAGHSSAAIPLAIQFPGTPGDYPESVQFSATNGASSSYPITRRTLIPTGFNIPFNTLITSAVGRAVGQINTYDINVPSGSTSISASFNTADASADNPYTFWLIDPNGNVVQKATTPVTVNGQSVATGTVAASNPIPGLWQIDVELNLTTSGNEFSQIVFGTASVTPGVNVGGSVQSTLGVSIGSGALTPALGSFVPGTAASYSTTIPASITSTAQTATLQASDASTTFPGHLVNTTAAGGPYEMPQGLQVDATSPNAAAAGGGNWVDLSGTNPATILTYTGPVANDVATIGFLQPVAATDPLRTGTYGKTITITLSTNTP